MVKGYIINDILYGFAVCPQRIGLHKHAVSPCNLTFKGFKLGNGSAGLNFNCKFARYFIQMNGMYISRLGSFAADGIKNNHKILSVAYGVCQARLYIRSIEMPHIFNGFVISVCNRFHEQGFFLIPHFQHFYRLSCRFGCFVIIYILFIIFCQNTFFSIVKCVHNLLHSVFIILSIKRSSVKTGRAA